MYSTRRLLSTVGWKSSRTRIVADEVASKSLHGNQSSVDYLVQILTSKVYDVAIESPLTYAANLSNILNNNIYLKREDLQPVFSFKIRGAYNKISNLSKEQQEKGVVTCSAGNHAQGVALSAAKLGIKATIVMPEATPNIKVSAVRRFGGDTTTVVLHGKNYDEAAAEAKRLVQEQGLTMVHPFDDPLVIAGQGTIGMEIIKGFKGKKIDAIFVCVGGGGMLAGVATYVKAIKPDVKIIGVEAEDAAGMTESLLANKVVTLPQVGLFADGAAVKTVGNETFRICSQLVDEVLHFSQDIFSNIFYSMVKYVAKYGISGQSMIAISSGANMDFDRLRFVSERADSSETLMSVTIPEQAIAGRPVEEDKATIVAILQSQGFALQDLSNNEMAKAHARHMSGGRAVRSFASGFTLDQSSSESQGDALYEVIYRFEFPEAPGALNRFLDTLNRFNQGWSISLFHYRNRGHDCGRVLVGFLEQLEYTYIDETNNASYELFLK
eukprot:gene24364-32809_t